MMTKSKPYFVLFRTAIPKENADTRVKGWVGEGLDIAERFEVVDRLKNKHKRDAALIVDLEEMVVERNATGFNDALAFAFAVENYRKEMAEGVYLWKVKTGQITPPPSQSEEQESSNDVT